MGAAAPAKVEGAIYKHDLLLLLLLTQQLLTQLLLDNVAQAIHARLLVTVPDLTLPRFVPLNRVGKLTQALTFHISQARRSL